MIFRDAVAFLLLLASLNSALAKIDCSQKPEYYNRSDLKAPMRFLVPEDYACLGNALNLPYLAVGVITKERRQFSSNSRKHMRPARRSNLLRPAETS